MNALADKVHKQELPCKQRYAFHNMATLFKNHPHIHVSNSGMPVSTKFTATYVGMVVEYVAMLWSAYHCVHGTSCLCTLSASEFIKPSLHLLDFFLEIFLWRHNNITAIV